MFAPVRRRRIRWLGMTMWVALAMRGGVVASTQDLEGVPVTAIEIRSDNPSLGMAEIEEFLAFEIGKPYARSDLMSSLRNIQASGLTSEVEIYAEGEGGGVEVTLALWSRIQVAEIRFEGELLAKPKELMSLLPMGESEPFVESRVLRARYELENFYTDRGYLDALVRPRPAIDDRTKQARVVFEIDHGPLFRIGAIDFVGNLGSLQASDLADRLRLKPEAPYRDRAVRTAAEDLERSLIESDFRLARVQTPQVEVDWESARVNLEISVNVGPRFHVEVHGADEKRLRKRGLLGFLGSQRYDEALLLQSMARLKRYYQELGFYRVVVDHSETRTEELVHLLVTVEPGELYSLSALSFRGNEAISERQLTLLMATTPKKVLGPGSGRLVDDVLQDDMANILSFYRLEGFWDAKVGPEEVRQGEGSELAVTIPVAEGIQRRTADLAFTGVVSVSQELLRSQSPLREGGPFHPRLLDQSVGAIRAVYESRGFEAAQVSTEVTWSEDGTLASVEVKVLEGPRSIVDRVILRGNRDTKAQVVRRAADLRSGDPINSTRLLEAQRAVYGLGAFSRVEVRRAPGVPFSGDRDIIIEVEEGSRHKVSYGAGWDSEDGFRGLLGYTRSNLFGRGVSSRIDLRASQRDSLARLLVYQPYLGRLRFPTTGSIFFIESTEESFRSRRRGGQAEIERIGAHARVGALLDVRLVEVLDLDPVFEEEIERDLQEVKISSFTPTYQIDHRDDPVDPTRGWTASIQAEYAFPFIFSEEQFLKPFLQYAHLVGLGRLGVLASSLRVGAIEPIKRTVPEDPTAPPGFESVLIPISERFFAGGRSTHRAYQRDRLGIVCETLLPTLAECPEDPGAPAPELSEDDSLVPVGGNGLLLVNLDYRFPIAGPIGGNVFFDAGNVWGDWDRIGFDDLKPGVGVGVRYLSPVGPVRLEIGWKLDRLPSEDGYVILFSVGNPY